MHIKIFIRNHTFGKLEKFFYAIVWTYTNLDIPDKFERVNYVGDIFMEIIHSIFVDYGNNKILRYDNFEHVLLLYKQLRGKTFRVNLYLWRGIEGIHHVNFMLHLNIFITSSRKP